MKKLVVVLAAALVATGIVATYLWQGFQAERDQNATLQARVEALESAQKSAASVSAPVTPAPEATGPEAKTAATTAAPAATPPAQRPVSALAAGVRQLMASPEGREMTRNQLRLILPQQYPDIGKELNLSPDEVNKLFDLLARQQADLTADSMDLLGGGNRDPAAMQEMQRKLQEKQQANDAELSAMLGSKYPHWQDYQQTLQARQQVSQLQSALGSGDNALSDTQSKLLITALAAEQQRIQQEARNAPPPAQAQNRKDVLEQQLQRVEDNNKRLVDVASSHLNATQLDSYKKMLDQQTNMARVVLRAMSQPGDAQGQAATAAP